MKDMKIVQIEESRKNFILSFFNIYINIIEGKLIIKEMLSRIELLERFEKNSKLYNT